MENIFNLSLPVFRDFHVVMRPHGPVVYLGELDTLYSACRQIYPEQPNPPQVQTPMKYWLGGPDPLDYVSMYSNSGDLDAAIPPHWHYVSFGLSNLHGDGRVHINSFPDTPRGSGFELTFRLKKEPEENSPPTWPAAIMQSMSKYIFLSGNEFLPGDHISWNCPLDNNDSKIKHMLLFQDPQLGTVRTPYGEVSFLQIVGVCTEELKAVQQWNGPGIIDLMKTVTGLGGSWLVTDMQRERTMFELNTTIQEAVHRGIEIQGSNLTCINAKCSWQELGGRICSAGEETSLERVFARISIQESKQIETTLVKGLLGSELCRSSSGNGNQDFAISTALSIKKEAYNIDVNTETAGSDSHQQTKYLECVHLILNLDAGILLPLALSGRLRHGKTFSFKNMVGDVSITLVPPRKSVAGIFADKEHPYAAHGSRLQVFLTDPEIEYILDDLVEVLERDTTTFPKTFEWCDKKLYVTLMEDCM